MPITKVYNEHFYKRDYHKAAALKFEISILVKAKRFKSYHDCVIHFH